MIVFGALLFKILTSSDNYLTGGIQCFLSFSGSLAHSVSDPFIALAGASGGCYALIGAHVATIITVSSMLAV